jgi:hypothetical protein
LANALNLCVIYLVGLALAIAAMVQLLPRDGDT